jgi:hypothetical protein
MTRYLVLIRRNNIETFQVEMSASNLWQLKRMAEGMYGPGSYLGYSVLYED